MMSLYQDGVYDADISQSHEGADCPRYLWMISQPLGTIGGRYGAGVMSARK